MGEMSGSMLKVLCASVERPPSRLTSNGLSVSITLSPSMYMAKREADVITGTAAASPGLSARPSAAEAALVPITLVPMLRATLVTTATPRAVRADVAVSPVSS